MTGNVRFIDSPTEQTTAITDVILAALALAAAIYIRLFGQQQPWKANLWAWAFSLLALAAFLGAIAHGLQMADATRKRVWHPLFLSLGLLMALFTVGVIYDIWGLTIARRVLPIMLIVGIVFFGVTLRWPDTFLVFILYQAIVMLFALGGYLWLAVGGHLAGAWLMVAGILVTIIAGGVQASNAVSITLIWQFDHNGTYHLIQMVGVVLLVAGLRAGSV